MALLFEHLVVQEDPTPVIRALSMQGYAEEAASVCSWCSLLPRARPTVLLSLSRCCRTSLHALTLLFSWLVTRVQLLSLDFVKELMGTDFKWDVFLSQEQEGFTFSSFGFHMCISLRGDLLLLACLPGNWKMEYKLLLLLCAQFVRCPHFLVQGVDSRRCHGLSFVPCGSLSLRNS